MTKIHISQQVSDSGHTVGLITLDSPKSLNALDQEMIDTLYHHLHEWQKDNNLVCVVIKSSKEKAFCAGGDVRALRKRILDGDNDAARHFFENEYRLNHLIHTYGKPVICWGNGVVMGGGIGLMSGATFRIVTDTSLLAMPEITIGLYPDVGCSWVLGKMPARTGLFMALTGCHLNPADAMYLGLANRFVDHAFLDNILNALQASDWSKGPYATVYDVIQHFSDQSKGWLPYSKIREHRDLICNLMDKPALSDIMDAIASLETQDEWLNRAKATAMAGSPLSAAIAYEQLKRTHHYSLKEAFQSELVLSVNCCLKGDLAEGVRALLVDKDQQPEWRYSSVSDISSSELNAFFESPWRINPLANL